MKAAVMLMILIFLANTVNTRKANPSLDPDKKIFIITLDGFRWKEIFYGADSGLIHSVGSEKAEVIRKSYWDYSFDDRRKKLLPFLWNIIGDQGQVFGNREYGNNVDVANPYGLSYPGYSELLTGKVDLSIYNNSSKYNSNTNILAKLNDDPAYKGKVAAFTSWNVFPYILNQKKSKIFLNSGGHYLPSKFSTDLSLLNKVNSNTSETRDDEISFAACTDYLKKKKPSVVFLGFSGTDDAGHLGKYDQYLQSAHKADSMIAVLWSWVQSTPEYAGKTSFIITTDHGRGIENSDWQKHGFFVPGSSNIWLALLGPEVVPAGELRYKNQFHLKSVSDLVFELLAK